MVCVKDESGNPFYFFVSKNKKIENGQPDRAGTTVEAWERPKKIRSV